MTEGYTGADIESLIKESQIADFCRSQNGISFEQFEYIYHVFNPLSTQFKAEIGRENRLLEDLGFRNVSATTEELPPSLSPTRVSFSSYEL